MTEAIRKYFDINESSMPSAEAADMLAERIAYLTKKYFEEDKVHRAYVFLAGFLDGMDYANAFVGGCPTVYMNKAKELTQEEFLCWLEANHE